MNFANIFIKNIFNDICNTMSYNYIETVSYIYEGGRLYGKVY